MAVHVICPSLRCRKILTLKDDVRGSVINCRYCNMEFRVPALRRAAQPSAQSPNPFRPETRPTAA